ncbi:MAG: hypothetical protein AB1775_05575 [Bacteroidota bacterium]
MTPEKIVLVIIGFAESKFEGKTLLQKQAYFISQFLGLDLGYKAHFYGPYSQTIEDAINYNKYLGFVNEECFVWGENPYGFEQKKFKYHVTKAGKKIIDLVKKKEKKEYRKIADVIKKIEKAGIIDDYIAISIAAKVYYILINSNDLQNITNEKIEKIAAKFGWNIDQKSIESAINFLRIMLDIK